MDGIGRELFNKSDKIKHYAIFQERPKFTAQGGVRIPLENLNPLGPRALSSAQTLLSISHLGRRNPNET
ncbi:hypothetical protein ASPCAL06101 [Aspergillus calidoustus]|uniref:Uncharacterized protein n=1 Tax=Aspergillus calidoustus TaxID=454130 RepID=A0A0U5G053_ASPCI|nr:hypothetical protein ASPCAL06101 [Aspergillus calidoustus]